MTVERNVCSQVQVDNQREDAMHPVLLKRRREGKARLNFESALKDSEFSQIPKVRLKPADETD